MPASEKNRPCGDGATDVARLCRTVSVLLENGSTLQSTHVRAPVTDSVLRASLESHLRVEETRVAAWEGRVPSEVVVGQAAGDIVTVGRAALKRFENGAAASTLSERERDALQAIIQVTGRPALTYVDGYVQLPTTDVAENEHWHVFIAVARKQIDRVSRSVGRVVIERNGAPPEVIGTAWRLGEDLLMTNRHVAEWLTVRGERDPSRWRLDGARAAVVDFAATEGTPKATRFPIVSLEYAAPERLIDIAVLRLELRGGGVPAGLMFDEKPEALGKWVENEGNGKFAGAEVYVVGHPLREEGSAQIDRVFTRADGKKRCSPGYVTSIGSRAPTLEHDCSTLGGNSGSCVVSRAGHAVVGIHFGSRGTDGLTGVADTNLAVALAQLGQHPVMTILRTGRVDRGL